MTWSCPWNPSTATAGCIDPPSTSDPNASRYLLTNRNNNHCHFEFEFNSIEFNQGERGRGGGFRRRIQGGKSPCQSNTEHIKNPIK